MDAFKTIRGDQREGQDHKLTLFNQHPLKVQVLWIPAWNGPSRSHDITAQKHAFWCPWCYHTASASRLHLQPGLAREEKRIISAFVYTTSISGKHWYTKYIRKEEDEWNRDIARLIDTLFRGQLHRKSLIFFTLLDHFLISWSGEDKKVKRRKNNTKVFLFCILTGLRLNISPMPALF